jgi:release factor glutamine methyltransferase
VREIRVGRKQTLTGEGLQIADIGTGSGCIAIALAKELPQATIFATDISLAALAVAHRNAVRHSVSDRMRFLECNLLERPTASPAPGSSVSAVGVQLYPARERRDAAPELGNTASGTEVVARITEHGPRSFDLIASNPPYIGRREAATLMREVRDHEPEVALYGGEEGYELYADLIAQSAAHLKPGGILVLELGHNTLPAVQPLLDSSQWADVGVTNDLAGIPRVLAAERK